MNSFSNKKIMDNIYCGFKKTDFYNGDNFFVALQHTHNKGALLAENVCQRDVLNNEIIKSFAFQDIKSKDLVSTIIEGVNNYNLKNINSISFYNTQEPDLKIIAIKKMASCYKFINTTDFTIAGIKNKRIAFIINPNEYDSKISNYKSFLNINSIYDFDDLVIYDTSIRDLFLKANYIFSETDFIFLLKSLSYTNFILILDKIKPSITKMS